MTGVSRSQRVLGSVLGTTDPAAKSRSGRWRHGRQRGPQFVRSLGSWDLKVHTVSKSMREKTTEHQSPAAERASAAPSFGGGSPRFPPGRRSAALLRRTRPRDVRDGLVDLRETPGSLGGAAWTSASRSRLSPNQGKPRGRSGARRTPSFAAAWLGVLQTSFRSSGSSSQARAGGLLSHGSAGTALAALALAGGQLHSPARAATVRSASPRGSAKVRPAASEQAA